MAADLTYSEPTQGDLDELLLNMRAHDRREVIAADGPDIEGTLRRGLAISTHSVAVRSETGLLAIYGCASSTLLNVVGSPWMLATPLIARHGCTLGKVTHRYLHAMLRVYPVLVNYVDARNRPAIRLLERIGFSIGEPESYGYAGLPFRRFEMRANERV